MFYSFFKLFLFLSFVVVSSPINAEKNNRLIDESKIIFNSKNYLASDNRTFKIQMDNATSAYLNQEYTTAITLWSKVIAAQPTTDIVNQALTNRAKAYLVIAQPSLALNDLNSIKRTSYSPDLSFEYSIVRGVVYLQLEKYKLALAEFSIARRINPYDSSPYLNS